MILYHFKSIFIRQFLLIISEMERDNHSLFINIYLVNKNVKDIFPQLFIIQIPNKALEEFHNIIKFYIVLFPKFFRFNLFFQ